MDFSDGHISYDVTEHEPSYEEASGRYAMLSKRDVKKSYYVWFLGAQEARVARGAKPALAALHRLERRAHDLDPFKVTLQVSPKGLKIIQNVDSRIKGGRGRNHTVKHFLPADSVTEVVSRGDAVVCVLLLYNPVTRCPLHAHAYRCDSEQTAQALCAQLRSVAGLGPERDDEEDERPPPVDEEHEQHIEPHHHPVHETRLDPEQELVAEKLAAELRKRLAGREPLLLPPRDYDTMRKEPSPAVQAPSQGRRPAKGVLGSSAGSSGIGSDLAPSPERPHTSSEEDWTESTAYMLHDAYESSARRARSPSPIKPSSNYQQHQQQQPPARNSSSADRTRGANGRQLGSVSPKDRFNVAKEKFINLEREKLNEEIEKRAQMRRNLNNILLRGPKTPAEIQAARRNNQKWPTEEEEEEEDEIRLERRAEVPRIVARNGSRDRGYREEVSAERRTSRERDYREGKVTSRDPMDMRDLKNVHPIRDHRDYRDHKEPKKDERFIREERSYRNEDDRNYRERGGQKDVKYLREYREVPDEKERQQPRLEHRYYEYRGERSDKHFDNRYKHDPRSDDEGVDSEKHFDEMRYPPRRVRDPPPTKKDARAELLEERQRQMESKRRDLPDERYERRVRADPRDWEVLRRSYAEAEQRPRRDPRTRHSYAEPVSRNRVGMATVAPF